MNLVPAHVSSFSGHSVNKSCIQLSILPPIMTGCNVSYYELSYHSLFGEENGFPSNETLAILFPVVNNGIIVCELRVNVLYDFAIAAVNEVGMGPTTAIRIYHYDPRFK